MEGTIDTNQAYLLLFDEVISIGAGVGMGAGCISSGRIGSGWWWLILRTGGSDAITHTTFHVTTDGKVLVSLRFRNRKSSMIQTRCKWANLVGMLRGSSGGGLRGWCLDFSLSSADAWLEAERGISFWLINWFQFYWCFFAFGTILFVTLDWRSFDSVLTQSFKNKNFQRALGYT